MPLENVDENRSPEDREKLLRELKKRLAEIEALKHALGVEAPVDSAPPSEHDSQARADALNDAIEELVVPPLELLDDRPAPQKKKKPLPGEASA